MVDVDNSQKTTGGGNIKQLSKNRAFIRALIDAYKEQDILWDTSQQSRNPQKKLEAYKTVLENLNGKYSTSATTKQIEVIIKRLRLRFIHQYRKMSSGIENSCYSSSIWFYDQLKFIEPHISGGKKVTN